MNRELIAARCEAGGLSIHEAAMKAWVDPVLLWEDPGSEADDRIPLGVLRRLCRILDLDLTELVERAAGTDPMIKTVTCSQTTCAWKQRSYNQNLWIDHPFEGAAYLPR